MHCQCTVNKICCHLYLLFGLCLAHSNKFNWWMVWKRHNCKRAYGFIDRMPSMQKSRRWNICKNIWGLWGEKNKISTSVFIQGHFKVVSTFKYLNIYFSSEKETRLFIHIDVNKKRLFLKYSWVSKSAYAYLN